MAEAGGGLGLEETELRLGLPGGDSAGAWKTSGKRAFADAIGLKRKLPVPGGVEAAAEEAAEEKMKRSASQNDLFACAAAAADGEKPPAPKAQVVGWPPVRSFRKNFLPHGSRLEEKEKSGGGATGFMKVSMDGAPYLRKVDLKLYKSYQELSTALEKMFSYFTSGSCSSERINGRDFTNESKLMDLLNGSEYVPTYEDKDGDWMLVGDVPWEMFVDSCKRLRIMKGSEAIGIAPRAMEKCRKEEMLSKLCVLQEC